MCWFYPTKFSNPKQKRERVRAVLGFRVLEEIPYPKLELSSYVSLSPKETSLKEGDDDDDDDDAFSIVMSEDDPPGNGGEPRRRDQSQQRRRRQKNLSLSVPKEDSGEYRWWGRFFFFRSRSTDIGVLLCLLLLSFSLSLSLFELTTTSRSTHRAKTGPGRERLPRGTSRSGNLGFKYPPRTCRNSTRRRNRNGRTRVTRKVSSRGLYRYRRRRRKARVRAEPRPWWIWLV